MAPDFFFFFTYNKTKYINIIRVFKMFQTDIFCNSTMCTYLLWWKGVHLSITYSLHTINSPTYNLIEINNMQRKYLINEINAYTI